MALLWLYHGLTLGAPWAYAGPTMAGVGVVLSAEATTQLQANEQTPHLDLDLDLDLDWDWDWDWDLDLDLDKNPEDDWEASEGTTRAPDHPEAQTRL